MAWVNFSRVPSALACAAGAASLLVMLTACGSDSGSDTEAAATTPSPRNVITPVTDVAPVSSLCPSAAPEAGVAPEWTLSGATGSVEVTGSTETAAPQITVNAPFSVTETQVQTLQAGDGPVVSDTATVLVCYQGVNGRDGSVFDDSYERGAPVDFPLANVVPGFQKAIAGQTVGSTVAVAMTSADGYPNGQPQAGIQPGDSLIFAIKVLDAAN